jgi:hypothetical protein
MNNDLNRYFLQLPSGLNAIKLYLILTIYFK